MFQDNLVLQIVFCIVMGYFFGTFPSGVIVAKANGVDIKHTGSGNAGTTNVLRTMGWKHGLITFGLDALKTFIPCILVRFVLFPQYTPFNWLSLSIYADEATLMSQLLVIYAGLGCALGHTFPFFSKFKGGKGIACMGATMLFFDWKLAVFGFATFCLIIWITRYMSIASLYASVLFPTYVALISKGTVHMIIVAACFTALAFFSHRANIKRLINHNENKFTVAHKNKGK